MNYYQAQRQWWKIVDLLVRFRKLTMKLVTLQHYFVENYPIIPVIGLILH